MDKLDRKIIAALERNPRVTYKELAKELMMSIPAVQRRVMAFFEEGVVSEMHTTLNLEALGGVFVIIYGESERGIDENVRKELARSRIVFRANEGDRGHIHLSLMLRGTADLPKAIELAKSACGIAQPTVLIVGKNSFIGKEPKAIYSTERLNDRTRSLHPLDYRIIWCLHKDCRKPIKVIAEELGVSVKTVRRRLNGLVHDGLIDFEIVVAPHAMDNILCLFWVKIGSAGSIDKVMGSLRKIPDGYIDEIVALDNMPDLLLIDGMVRTIGEVNGITEQLRRIDGVVSVRPDIIMSLYRFDTWVDDHLERTIISMGRGK